MSVPMRAKLYVTHVDKLNPSYQTVYFSAVSADKYPEDGSDENNTYAKFSPSAHLQLSIANPALLDKYAPGDHFYVDFTPCEK